MRLKDVASVNIRTLDENTPGDYAFKYIDISSVSFENGIDLGQDIEFSQAPSRARRIVKKGDVLVSTVRTYLRAIADIDWEADNVVASTGFAVFSPNDTIIPRFMAYVVKSSDVINQICSNSKGVSYPAIQASSLSAVEIPYFDISMQEAIAAYLDRECEKIGRQIELLERKADAYKRLRRSLINRAVTRGLNPDVHLKPSGNDWIGDIPQHWRIERNKNLLIERKDIVGEDKSFKLLSLTLNGIIIRDMEAGGKFPAEFNSYKKVHPNNLVFCLFDMDETPRTIGLSSYTGMITGAYDVFVVVPEVVSPKWVYYFYFDIDQRKALKPYYTGLRKVVKTQKFANIHIPIPPNKEQQEIVAYLDEKCAKIDAIIEKIGTKIERLKELKRSLINEVVTGKRAINNI